MTKTKQLHIKKIKDTRTRGCLFKPPSTFTTGSRHIDLDTFVSVVTVTRMACFRSVNARIDQLFEDFANIRMTNQFLHLNFVPFVFL